MASNEVNTATGRHALSRRAALVWASATVVLIALGAPFLFIRLSEGLMAADTTNRVPWGLWVVAYTWFSGLAGGMFLISSLWYLFRIKAFAAIARLSLVGSLVFLIASAILIALDLGVLGNVAGALLFFRWSSALSWEVKLCTVLLIIMTVQLALVVTCGSVREEQRGNRNFAIRVLAGVGVALSFVGVPSGTGMLFAAVGARDLWSGGATVVSFYAAALVMAAAFLLIVCIVLARLRHEAPERGATKGLSYVLLAALAVSIFVTFFQLMSSLFPVESSGGQAARLILMGSFAPLFWIGAVGIGSVLPIALAVKTLRKGGGTCAAIAGFSALIGVFSLRYAFVTVGFLVPLLPGLPTASYVPSVFEIGVVVFASGIALGLFGLFIRLFDPASIGVGRNGTTVAWGDAKQVIGGGAEK